MKNMLRKISDANGSKSMPAPKTVTLATATAHECSPFVRSVQDEILLVKTKHRTLETCGGVIDSDDHLAHFHGVMKL